jgi:hypothetical protein
MRTIALERTREAIRLVGDVWLGRSVVKYLRHGMPFVNVPAKQRDPQRDKARNDRRSVENAVLKL